MVGPVEEFLMKRKGLKIKKEEERVSTRLVKEEDSGDQNCKKERSETENKLRAIQDVKIESWLDKEMKKVKLEEGTDPTPDEIRLQLRLPSTSEGFQEPVKIWQVILVYFCVLPFLLFVLFPNCSKVPFLFQGDQHHKRAWMEQGSPCKGRGKGTDKMMR